MAEGKTEVLPKGAETLYRIDPKSDLERMFDRRERQSYREVLGASRKKCPSGTHVMTLADYMGVWRKYFENEVISCAISDINKDMPTPQTPGMFDFPVLVDTYLTNWEMKGINYMTLEAEVIDGGKSKGKIRIPSQGKIYEINKFGLPSKTGGAKTSSSEPFIHTWWAFSLPEIIEPIGDGKVKQNFDMALFANGGIMGCFYEFLKAHYSLDDREGFYQVLSFPDKPE